jgi:hypothetical protein
MRKTIMTMLGSALLACSLIPAASGAEHHRDRVAHRAPAPISEQVRDANAFAAPQPGWSDHTGYYSHGFSAPAGH